MTGSWEQNTILYNPSDEWEQNTTLYNTSDDWLLGTEHNII